MNVLIVGSGGREHALAWKISQSTRVKDVFVAPGNAGTAIDAVNVDLDLDDYAAMVRYAKSNGVGLTVVDLRYRWPMDVWMYLKQRV